MTLYRGKIVIFIAGNNFYAIVYTTHFLPVVFRTERSGETMFSKSVPSRLRYSSNRKKKHI